MSIRSKSKASALSTIPWGQRKQRSKKPVIPWKAKALKDGVKDPETAQHRLNQAAIRHQRGQRGEERALEHLLASGLTLIEQNYRCRCGELDLVMQDGQTAVVVEVRVRNGNSHGDAASSVTHSKQNRISQCAKLWWVRRGQQNWKSMRFDVVAVSENTDLQWIQNAWLLSE